MEEEKQTQNDEKLNKSDIKKGISIGIGIFFGAILIVFLTLLIAGFQFFYVLTDSMSPTVNRGEMVIVNTNVDKQNLKVGDIVSFNSGAVVVTHRIVEVCYDENNVVYYKQAPDITYRKMLGEDISQTAQDPQILASDSIIGRVVTIGNNPIKLYVLASIVGLFNGAGVLNFIKVVLIIAIIVLIVWTVISSIVGKKKKK